MFLVGCTLFLFSFSLSRFICTCFESLVVCKSSEASSATDRLLLKLTPSSAPWSFQECSSLEAVKSVRVCRSVCALARTWITSSQLRESKLGEVGEGA